MALDPIISRGYQGQIGNALQDARREQRTNTLLDLRAQEMQNELDDDAEWDQAYAARDINTLRRIDPTVAAVVEEQWRAEKMSGLGDVSIWRKPVQEPQVAMRPQVINDGGYSYMFDPSKGVVPSSVQAPQREPMREPPQPQLKDITLPDGTVQPMWLRPGESTGTPVGAPTKPSGKNATPLRKEFNNLPEVKSFGIVLPNLLAARNAPDSAAGDLMIVYNTAKLLDDQSAVKEGETQMVLGAANPVSKIIGAGRFNFEGKGRLTPEVRKQLLTMLNTKAVEVRSQYDRVRGQYAGYAQAEGISPNDVVGTHPANAAKQPNRQTPVSEPVKHASGATYVIESE
jgi:hypothetical protein